MAVDYTYFNKFQTYFYTSIEGFNTFSDFEIKENAFTLMVNMGKGFPQRADDILNVYAKDMIDFQQCPSLIRALQRRFVNGFVRPRVPQFIYYKSLTAKTTSKAKPKSLTTDKGLEFSSDIAMEIKSRLMLDEKDYQHFKYSPKIQRLGKFLSDEYDMRISAEITKSKKR